MDKKMPRTRFNRGLDQNFVDLLNEMYNESGSWWRKFVDDKDLFLAIRNNYINVYYRGNNLLKLERQGRGRNRIIVGKIHYKYLLRPNLIDTPSLTGPARYISLVNGRPNYPENMKDVFRENATNISALKEGAECYAKPEKRGVHDIILANLNILDIEIGFGTPRSYVDFAALRETKQGIEIRFFEAKLFNNGELRTEGCADPKVISQIERYKCLIKKNRQALIDSYRKVCCNLLCIQGIAKKYQKYHEVLESVAAGSKLCIDENPRLVVFGYDRDQENGKVRAKLEKKLKGRVFFKRDSRGFTHGISEGFH